MGDDAMDSALEAALLGMEAKHAHDFDPDDDAAAQAGTGTRSDNGADTDGDDSPTFDTQEFLRGLDAIFEAHDAAEKAGPYLEQAMVDAENAGDDAGLLTVLNETMGFYRSQGRHEENQWIVQRAIELALRMGLEGSEAWATTLINCATAMRAAKRYDQAEDLYKQALACAERNFDPKDRRLAALHNNLSMLYSETGRIHEAELELREALRVVEVSSVNPDADIDVASSHTNLALVLLEEGKLEGADWHASKALEIYRTGHLEHSAHYASALAGLAQVRYAEHRFDDAVTHYRQALVVIEECYGRNTDYYRITESNLREAEAKAAGSTGTAAPSTEPAAGSAEPEDSAAPEPTAPPASPVSP
ncbi:tetratricopeptide repeat protein, partial [Bifidobacterium sp. MA2]|nr:tetratricopeptide repeat protein [Bifidobacterium santillanense]